MVLVAILVVLASSLSLADASAPSKRWSPTVRIICDLRNRSSTHKGLYHGQDPIDADLTWGTCTDFGVADPDPNLSCGYYEVPMDYFDSAAGKARLAVVKYQATVPNKKGTLFMNPGTIEAYDSGLTQIAYAEALQVDLEYLVLDSCLPWELILVRISRDNTTLSLGILAAPALTHCEFSPPRLPNRQRLRPWGHGLSWLHAHHPSIMYLRTLLMTFPISPAPVT